MEQIGLAAPGGELSLWALFIQAGFVVKLVMIGLLAASVWSWAVMIDKTLAFGRMRRAFNRFEDTFWSGQSLEELYRSLADKQADRHGRAVRGGDARVEEDRSSAARNRR
jgi:biopolymer transport protein TolQ